MARLLVQQTAYGAAPALHLQDEEQLQWLASALVLDPKVMSASIYSIQGKRLAFAQSVTELVMKPESEEMSDLLEQYSPFVEPVLQAGKNLGYVEVRLNKTRFFDQIKEAHQLNMQQQQLMLLIAGLIGLLLSRSMSFKRADFERRKLRVKRAQTDRRKTSDKPKTSEIPEQEQRKKSQLVGHKNDNALDLDVLSDADIEDASTIDMNKPSPPNTEAAKSTEPESATDEDQASASAKNVDK